MGRDPRERVALETVARVEEPRRDPARRRRRDPRSKTGLCFLRQVELVRGVADGVLPLGRILETPENLADADERVIEGDGRPARTFPNASNWGL